MNGKLKCPRVRGIPESEWRRGIAVEMEHTSSAAVARCIASAHLRESPRYYIELLKMEKRLKRSRA